MNAFRITFVLTAALSLAACSPAGSFLAPSISCDDRLCSMSENILIDQSHVLGVDAYDGDIQTQGLLDGLLSLTPTLTLVGTLAPPLVNGTSVQASDITVNGTKVYVGYNTAGEIQSGAIDVIDVSNPNLATLAS